MRSTALTNTNDTVIADSNLHQWHQGYCSGPPVACVLLAPLGFTKLLQDDQPRCMLQGTLAHMYNKPPAPGNNCVLCSTRSTFTMWRRDFSAEAHAIGTPKGTKTHASHEMACTIVIRHAAQVQGATKTPLSHK